MECTALTPYTRRFIPVEQGDDTFDPAVFEQHLLAMWKQLFNGDSVTCEALDGSPHAPCLLESPLSAVVIDVREALRPISRLYS